MPYVRRSIISINTYAPSDIVVVSSVANTTNTDAVGLPYKKVKELLLVSDIGSTSKFRFKFYLHHGAMHGDVYGKIYRNGLAVGTERVNNADAPGIEYTEDINTSTWRRTDTVELWTKNTGVAGVQATVHDFCLCGSGSEFKISLE